ncbi:MAG: hypothetical protein NC548_38760 [Lachnospiraceae bacterium]|nr:hypothetical protein [Lachnospiraceae bacterium]
MIKISEIRAEIARMLEATGIDYITGEDLQQERDYWEAMDGAGEDRRILQITIVPEGASTLDAGHLTERTILVDIAYFKGVDTSRRDIQDVLEKIDGIMRPCIRVRDRCFTVQNAGCSITDNMGHYEFNIRFIDGDSMEAEEPRADTLQFRFKEV